MISGGSCRSASITTTASPGAWSNPAVNAASLPKLRERPRIVACVSCRCRASMTGAGGVAAAVVDVDDVPWQPDAVHRAAEPVMECGQHGRLVIAGHDNRDGEARHDGSSRIERSRSPSRRVSRFMPRSIGRVGFVTSNLSTTSPPLGSGRSACNSAIARSGTIQVVTCFPLAQTSDSLHPAWRFGQPDSAGSSW